MNGEHLKCERRKPRLRDKKIIGFNSMATLLETRFELLSSSIYGAC
jgi:hypothetical protein